MNLGAWMADEPRRRYLERVPHEVIRVVRQFVPLHWHLLFFASRCGDAGTDLLQANPALGFMLALNRYFRPDPRTPPMVAARLQLRPGRSQRDILAWLGFPPTEPVRRILRKVAPRALTLLGLREFRTRIADPKRQQRLAHLPRIADPVLSLAASGLDGYLSPRLLLALATDLDARRSFRHFLVADTVRMWLLARPHDPVPTFGSLRRLREEHERLAQGVDWRTLFSEDAPFPRTPLAGTSSIVPLDSDALLFEEGQAQRNCVASYTSHVREGDVFVYRVLAPTRATVSIVRRGGRWRIEQLCSAANQPVPEATRKAVLAWLHGAQPRQQRRSVPGQLSLWDEDEERGPTA